MIATSKPLLITIILCSLIFQSKKSSSAFTETYPIFIGYTEKVPAGNQNVGIMAPVKIHSLAEFEHRFGKGPEKAHEEFYLLYNSMRLFYANGGGTCYIVSVGGYTRSSASISKYDLLSGLKSIPSFDNPTLLVIPEAALLHPADAGSVHKAMLEKAFQMGNSFAILDIVHGDRPMNSGESPIMNFRNNVGNEYLRYGAAYYPWLKTTFTKKGSGTTILESTPQRMISRTKRLRMDRYDAGTQVSPQSIILPPGAAVAAKFARTDKQNGIWKTAANIDISEVVAPEVRLDDADTEVLNIDKKTGKSINAIRFFPGKGTLIWGARTLAGNDDEWRYITVSRLAEKIKADLTKITSQFSTLANDAGTWQSVKNEAEEYLIEIWRKGALAGSNPKTAFFVKVGLNQSMTQADISNGKMVVNVGFAPIKPAEFHTISIEQRMERIIQPKKLIRWKSFPNR